MAKMKSKGYGQSYNKSPKVKRSSDGRVTTKKSAIDPNPAGRTVYMETGSAPKGSKKKGSY